MARIVYFISPLDESKTVEITSKGTLRYALRELGIENDPLCVSINGMTPEELNIDSTILDDTDVVEVRRLVNGGGDSNTKSTLATIIQIAGLIASVYFPPFAAVILIGTSIAAGALNKWALDLKNKGVGTSDEEIDVAANAYSLSTSTNEARPLRPVPVVMGSHRFAPDVQTDAFVSQYGIGYVINTSDPYYALFTPGINASNGPEATDNSWAVMDAGEISAGVPLYRLKVAPYRFTNKLTALTPTENDDIIQAVLDSLENPQFVSYTYSMVSPYPITKSYPIVVYHDDPADPYYGRFNILQSIVRNSQIAGHDWSYLAGLFNGSFAGFGSIGAFTPYFFTGAGPIQLVRAFPGLNFYFPNNYTPSLDAGTNVINLTNWGNMIRAMNGGSYTSTPKTTCFSAPIWLRDSNLTGVGEGIPYSAQLFNFGLGDVTISDEQVGSLDITPGSADTAQSSVINKTAPDTSRWSIPSVTTSWGNVGFPIDVFNNEEKSLINSETVDIGIIDPGDMNPYNFVYFSGQRRMDTLSFAFSGLVYSTSGSGIGSNTTRIQLQWKWSSDAVWTDYVYPIITVTNADTKPVYISYRVDSTITGSANYEDDFLEMRVRKVTLDSVDNDGNKICNLKIKDIYFFKSVSGAINNDWNKANAPMNINGLMITALISDNAKTNKYSALVESKCWVYDFDTSTWVWEHTRNPAWWFLFFARGGFFNYESVGAYPPPYSPTYGWQNYPGHPNNTELMFGGGYTDDQIDVEKIQEWGFFCEENDLVIDLVAKDDGNVADVLERIANVGRASVSYYTGKLSVVIEDPEQVPVCLFGMANIKAGSFNVEYAVGDQIASVVAKYTNRDTWDSAEVQAAVPFADADNIRKLEMTFVGITDPDLAQREVNILAARQFYQRRIYRWKTDVQGYLARRGDLVYLSHDSTQYGYSGAVMDFVIEAGVVIGIKVSAFVDQTVTWVTIRSPANVLETYACHWENDMIVFDDPYAIEDASYYFNVNEENLLSDFNKSIPEDYSFIADIKSTTGKRVRISEISGSDTGEFSITAIDEDPAMWSYEFGPPIDSESFDDSIQVCEILDFKWVDNGSGQLRLMWNMTGEFAQVINLNTGLPLEANGQYSFSEGDVIFDLVSGVQYQLEIRPFVIGEAHRTKNQKVNVWLQ